MTPLRNWLAALINGLVRKYFGYDDIEFAWGERRDENLLEQAQINQIYVASGVLTIDEVREALGRDPIGESADPTPVIGPSGEVRTSEPFAVANG